MYSDEWIKKGYKHLSQKNIAETITFSEWVNESNTIIGVSLSFNFESDVHFELLIEDWNRFLVEVLKEDSNEKLMKYFDCEAPYLKLIDDLKSNGIKYQKIAFY